MDRKPGQPIRIFYSYAKEDSELQEELEKHLSPLQQRGLIEPWSNRLINAGKEWANEIDQHIKSSDIILLLLSSDFFYSDYIYGTEMQIALERQKANEAQVIPILMRSVNYAGTPISNLQILPKNEQAITNWPDRDAAFAEVAKNIHLIVSELYENSLKHSLFQGGRRV